MAQVVFYTPDGDQKRHAVSPDRPLRIGRDPSNDLVLRDPKVSRNHARIVWERGFYVLYDLSSANGSFINERRVNIAPLRDGIDIRLGNSRGRFTDEAGQTPKPPDVDEPIEPTTVSDLADFRTGDRKRADAAPDPVNHEEGDDLPSEPAIDSSSERETIPQPLADDELRDEILRERDRRRSREQPSSGGDDDRTLPPPTPRREARSAGGGTVAAPMPEEIPLPPVTGPKSEPLDAGPKKPRPWYDVNRFLIDLSVPYGERSTIATESGDPLVYFRRPFNLTPFIASLVASMILVAGLAAAVLLFVEREPVLGLAALFLTALFDIVVLMLVPRRHVQLFRDRAMTEVALSLWQESRFGFPWLRFSARDDREQIIATFERNWIAHLSRRKWWILDQYAIERIGFAQEDSLSRAMVRKISGPIFGTTDFLIHVQGRTVGRINRRSPVLERYLVDLTDDREKVLDRRVAIALAVIVDAIERR